MKRPIHTDEYTSAGIFTNQFVNGSVTTSETIGPSALYEDHPIVGTDTTPVNGEFRITSDYLLRTRRLDYPKGKISGTLNNGQRRVWLDNLRAFGLTPPAGFGGIAPSDQFSSLQSATVVAALDDLKAQAANLLVFYAERMEAGALVLGAMATAVAGLRRLRGELMRTYASRRVGKRIYSESWPAWKQRFSDWYDVAKTMPLEVLIRKAGRWATAKWLEYVFGVRPLIDEAGGIIDSVSKPPRDQVVRIVKTRTSLANQVVDDLKIFQSTINVRWKGIRKTRQSCRVILKAEVEYPVLATAASLGLTNLPQVAWELVPFSWALDTWLPIGGWLSSLDADLAWGIHKGSCISFKSKLRGEYSAYEVSPRSSWKTLSGTAACNEEALLFQRTPWDSLAPFPSFRLPSAVPLTQTFSNLLAILTQALTGSPIPKGARI